MVLPDCGLSYPAAEHVREIIQEAAWTTAAPPVLEMAETCVSQHTTPPTTHIAEHDIVEGETTVKIENGKARIRGASNDISDGGNGTIPFADDVAGENCDEEHEAMDPRHTNGLCGDAYHLIASGDGVAIKEARRPSELTSGPRGDTLGAADQKDVPLPVLLNCRNIRFTDYTAAKVSP